MENNWSINILAPMNEDDKTWLKDLWLSEWGSGEIMMSKGKRYHLQDMDVLIAWADDVRVGAVTYRIGSDDCEMMSFNASVKGVGIGSALTAELESRMLQSGVNRISLITTNDNLDALRFYQRRGYRIKGIYPNAIDEARKLKPTIPQVGYYEIPIRDEIELEKIL